MCTLGIIKEYFRGVHFEDWNETLKQKETCQNAWDTCGFILY